MNKTIRNPLTDSFFDDINGKSLDIHQRKIVIDNNQNTLVVAGAGSGKTLTIIAKIKYLIEKQNIKVENILCISFTNETVTNLKNKIGYKVDCFTFHKLALTILNDFNYQYNISGDNLLEYLVNEFFVCLIFQYNLTNYVTDYFKEIIKEEFTYDDLKTKYHNQFNNYLNSIISFIKKIKTNNHHPNNFYNYLLKNKYMKQKEQNKNFLIIVFNVLLIYNDELKSTGSIDFDDMISISTNIVKESGIKKKYQYIIIDEFQDTSWIRYELIKSILEKTNAKLMCVGDDYQSIYGFSGCNLDLFVNFQKYFPNSKIMYIKNTYRNCYHIIKTSTTFVKKNKYQLKKNLKAQFFLKKPLKIIYYHKNNYKKTFYNLLEYLYQNNQKNILVLGRYNNDINLVLENDYNEKIEYKDMSITYLTVHRSKGLEGDNIILLNMSDDYLGFPSKIENDQIFNLIDTNKEKYPYFEERRLFYVALTRTKNNVYMLVPRSNPSIFITEIINKTVELIVK